MEGRKAEEEVKGEGEEEAEEGGTGRPVGWRGRRGEGEADVMRGEGLVEGGGISGVDKPTGSAGVMGTGEGSGDSEGIASGDLMTCGVRLDG